MSTTRSYGLKDTSGLAYNGAASGTQTKDTNGTVWYGYVIDKAGNTKDCNSTVKKDSQNPRCELKQNGTLGVDGWYRSNVTLTFNPREDINKDGVQSGLAYYQIDTSSGNPSSWTTETSDTQTADTSGTTWYGHVKDKAGHTASCSTKVYKDTVPPTCTISASGNVGNNGWYVGNVSITLSNRSDDRSGIYQYGIGSYNSSTSTSQTSDTTGTTYVGMVKDKAGNEATCRGTVKKDTVAPSCNVSLSQNQSSSGVSGTVSCSDSTSGCTSGSSHNFSNLKASTSGDANGQNGQAISYVIDARSHGAYSISDRAGHSTDCYVRVFSYCEFNYCSNYQCGVRLYNRCEEAGCEAYSGWVLSETEEIENHDLPCYSFNEENTYTKRTCSNSGDANWCYCRWYLKSCTRHKRGAACGVESYYACRTPGCGCETYYYRYDKAEFNQHPSSGSSYGVSCGSGMGGVGGNEAMLCN